MANGKDFASEPIRDGGNGGGEQWPRNVGCVISGFRREVDENCVLMSYYAANSGKFLTDVSGQLIGPTFKGRSYLQDP
jgi:hypothetical protein